MKREEATPCRCVGGACVRNWLARWFTEAEISVSLPPSTSSKQDFENDIVQELWFVALHNPSKSQAAARRL